MIRATRLVVLCVAGALLAASCAAFEESPAGSEGPNASGGASEGASPPGSSGPGGAGGAAQLNARPVTIAEFDTIADGEVVRVVGLIRAPSMTTTYQGFCSLQLEDSTKPSRSITVEVAVSKTSPPSTNCMAELPESYRATDLLLTASDGTAIHDGDGVALTGTVSKGSYGTNRLEFVTRIDPAAAPLPAPIAVNFKTIKKQKADTLVRLTGRLDVGIFTMCSRTCPIYLEDPATGGTISIDVALGTKNQRIPNTMWPLGSNYSRSSLRVITNDGRLLKGGARVRVTGWIDISGNGKRGIDPVVRIDAAP